MPRRARLLGSLCATCLVSALLLPCVLAQDATRTLLLVARPELPDANFRDTVVMVSQSDNSETIGLILNRPLTRSLADVLPGERFSRFSEPLYFGGPVANNVLIALFRGPRTSDQTVAMLPDVQLALDPDTIDGLLRKPPATIRFFSGYSGWGPGQLMAEVSRGDWFVLDADADTPFRKDPSRLWPELSRRARAVRADAGADAREPRTRRAL
jgi:putative transcriptional regulator